jgi:hypothetical protein
MEKRAQQRLYQLNLGAVEELDQWVQRLTELWNRRFDALERVLDSEKKKKLIGPNRKDEWYGKPKD